MKVGTILIAINPCKINRVATLTKGEEYKVMRLTKKTESIEIIDDQGDPHYFSQSVKGSWTKYFRIKDSQM